MRLYEVELEIGQTLKVGDKLVTVIDIDGGEISLRIEEIDAALEGFAEAEPTPVRYLPR